MAMAQQPEQSTDPIYFEFSPLKEMERTQALIYPWGINNGTVTSFQMHSGGIMSCDRLYIRIPPKTPNGELVFSISGIIRIRVDIAMWQRFSIEDEIPKVVGTHTETKREQYVPGFLGIIHKKEVHEQSTTTNIIDYPLGDIVLRPADCMSVTFTPSEKPLVSKIKISIVFKSTPIQQYYDTKTRGRYEWTSTNI